MRPGAKPASSSSRSCRCRLPDLGHSLWLDNITRDRLDSGRLKRYVDELPVSGLTSNPTILDHAIKESVVYDATILANTAATSAEGGED